MNSLNYGSAGGGFYWDFSSGTVWTSERGWHIYSPASPPPSATLWADYLSYGSVGGGFYLDPLSGQVWTAERGWHRFNPRPNAANLPFHLSPTCSGQGVWCDITPASHTTLETRAKVVDIGPASAGSSRVLAVTDDGAVLAWDVEHQAWTMAGPPLPTRPLKAFPAGKAALAGTPTTRLFGATDRLVSTTDGWLTRSDHPSPSPTGTFTQSVAIDPSNPARVLVGTSDGVYRVEPGAAWAPVDQGIGTKGFIVWSLAFASDNPKLVLAGVEDQTKAMAGVPASQTHVPRLFRSTDGGLSFSEIAVPGFWNPIDLLFFPGTPGKVLMATEGVGVWMSLDAGLTWKRKPIASPDVARFALDPSDETRVFAATLPFSGGPGGVYASSDGGLTWSALPGGLSHTVVGDLAVDPSGSQLIVTALLCTRQRWQGCPAAATGSAATNDAAVLWTSIR